MKSLLFFIFLFVSYSCSTDKSTIIASISDDYIIKFSFTKGQDIYENGQNIGNVFYIYQNGLIRRFDIIYEEDDKYLKSWNIELNQIDSLHLMFDKTGFDEFPEHFPGPPIIGPASSTSIIYRENVESKFKHISSILSQEESRYPDGFLELYSYLSSICFEEQ